MVKQLLSLAAVAAVALSANAYDLPLTSEDTSDNAPLYAGWGSTYDQATKTITYADDWCGRGWGFWDAPFDGTNFTDVVIEFAETNVPGQVIVQYSQLVYDEDGNVVQEWGNDKHEMTVKSFNAGDKEITIALNPEYKNSIDQIYLQCGGISGIDSPTIVLASAQIVDNSGAPINYVAFEGAQEIDWWLEAVLISTDFFPYMVEGAKIDVTVTPIGEGGIFKLQTNNADWTQTWLPSQADILGASVAEDGSDCHISVTEAGIVECPIDEATAAVIAKPGVQSIMIVGQGVIVNKVEIIPAGGTDGIADIEMNNAPAVYYNLQGMPVVNPAQGKVYIVVRGNKATKELIR